MSERVNLYSTVKSKPMEIKENIICYGIYTKVYPRCMFVTCITHNMGSLPVCLGCKTVSTGQISITQGRTTHDKFFMALSNFLF